jgi:hypothetical protein
LKKFHLHSQQQSSPVVRAHKVARGHRCFHYRTMSVWTKARLSRLMRFHLRSECPTEEIKLYHTEVSNHIQPARQGKYNRPGSRVIRRTVLAQFSECTKPEQVGVLRNWQCVYSGVHNKVGFFIILRHLEVCPRETKEFVLPTILCT